VSGLGLRSDGVVIPLTATYSGADPLNQELSLWGALYTFDSEATCSSAPPGAWPASSGLASDRTEPRT
jgi:hypothetical protein